LLQRRLGFGGTGADLDELATLGYDAALDRLLSMGTGDAADQLGPPLISAYQPVRQAVANGDAQQLRTDAQTLVRWWIDRMVVTSRPTLEKMALVWHGHFATGISKVRSPALMYQQNQVLRQHALGSFAELALAVAKDPAMMIWLDTFQDVKGKPNENFARELMELFTLGLNHYSEADVKEAARCFTGWSLDRSTGQFLFRPTLHDSAGKTLLAKPADTGEDAVAILTSHPDCARFITARLWSRLARPVPVTDPVVADLAPGFAAHGDITELVRSIALHPAFRTPEVAAGLVKQPVEWYVGALRALGLRVGPLAELGDLRDLGQVPFNPPSVGGWPPNAYWLSSATALARLTLVTRMAKRADLSELEGGPTQQRPATLARWLGVDQWSSASGRAIANGTAAESLAIALVSPEYVLA